MSKADWQQTSRTTSGGLLRSVASLLPRSPSDFGTVRCWARNAVGYQAKPCLFHLRQLPSSSTGQRQKTRQQRLQTKTSASGQGTGQQQQQQHYHRIDTSDLSTNENEDGREDVRESEETSLIGTSSSGSALSPSSYLASGTVPQQRSSSSNLGTDMSHANSHSFLEGKEDEEGGHDREGGEDDAEDDERTFQEDVKASKSRRPLDRKESRRSEAALPSPPPQQHRLLNHLCHQANRTTEELLLLPASDGLNCSNTARKWRPSCCSFTRQRNALFPCSVRD